MSGFLAARTTGRLDDEVFTLAYAGAELGMTYIQPYVEDRIFGSRPRQLRICVPAGSVGGASPAGQLAAARSGLAVGPPADLTVVVAPPVTYIPGPAGPGLELPLRLTFVVDLDDASATARPSAKERRRQLRRLERYAHSYEVSHAESDFDGFYRDMYLPTMACRHQSRARVCRRAEALGLFRSGMIFFLTSASARVAGVLCELREDTCVARLVGWRHGQAELLRQEVAKTTYHLLIDWARQAGLREVDFQGCEPFLRKGTFQAKRRLGARAMILGDQAVAHRAWVEPGRDTARVRDFLAANPAIHVGPDGSLYAGYCYDSSRSAATDIPYSCSGITGARRIDLDQLLGGLQ
jgi:hypothetical protein